MKTKASMLAFAAYAMMLLLLIGVQAAFAQCPGGEAFFEGSGEGASAAKAKEAADMDIARQIFSSVASVSRDSLYQKETDDDYEEFSERTRIATVKVYLPNANMAKDKNPPRNEGGKFVAERYMCYSDAARPYLDSLKILARALKSQNAGKSSCDAINSTHSSIEKMESLLEHLGRRAEGIKKEFKAIQKEYESDGKAGIYLDVREDIFGKKSDVISSKLKEALSGDNCRIEQNACKTGGGFTLRVKAEACNHKNDGFFDHCSSCVKTDLLNGRNDIIISPSVATKASWGNKEAACEKAFEQAAREIWEQIKTKTTEVCK